MRVLIDTTYARLAPFSGTAVYVEQLCRALRAGGAVEVVETENPRRRPRGGGGLASARNLAVESAWTAFELQRQARRMGAEIVHHPLPALGRGGVAAQVITVHDLAFLRLPECFAPAFRRYARLAHRAAARRAAAVICVSETTAGDVRELWGVAPERIFVAPLGPGQAESTAGPPARGPAAARHLLYVGDAEPRKNLPVLLSAYARYREEAELPLDLVLAGGADAEAPGIRVARRPDAPALRQLYGQAAALVQPSLYEGFGLTALEAMALGVPVIAAHSPGLTETCAEAARYFEARSAPSLAAALREVAEQEALAAGLRAAGLVRAREFSWQRCARAHTEAYSLVLGAYSVARQT